MSSDTNTDRGDEPGRNLETGSGEPRVPGSEPAGVMEAAPGIAVEYRILGPIEVARAAGVAQLRGRGPRVLLCTLLLNRNRAVSMDRLIEALWGESAPPTATKTVQVYVSQLRKAMAALGGAAERQLETHGHGYLLRVEAGQLDADRFQALVDQGRELRAAGDSETAALRLEEALALWRGPALADLAYEEAAREEIARLDELRIAALEERIDADLDCGRHAELIPELQGLVGQHPSRERLRGQLMLALYRSGRQSEAVNAYADARRALSEELGIEPGPELRDLERRVLAHDPTLAPPRRAPLAAAGDGSRRRWLLLAGAALLLAVAVAAAAVELTSGGTQAGIATLAGDSVGLIDPTTGRIVGQFPLGATPSQVVAGEHAMWTANTDQSIVARVDLATGDVRRTGAPTPTGVALGAGSLWVSSATTLGNSGSYAIRLLRLDPTTLRQQAPPIVLAARTHWYGERTPMLVTAGRLWVAAMPGKLIGVDPTSGRISRIVRVVDPRFGAVSLTGMAALNGAIWAETDARWVVRIDPGSGAVTRTVELSLISFGTMAAGAGSLWVTDPLYGRVWRVDPQPPYNRHDIITGLNASDIAFGRGAAWVTSAVDGTLSRIDPTDEHLRRFPVGNTPGAVTVSAVGVLISAVGGSQAAGAAGSAVPPGGAVAVDSCGSVISEAAARPRYLLVADLALDPADATYTRRMAQAVEYELRAHDFSAGRYTLGLQICDDSGTNACTVNPKAYAATPTVIGVIGPTSSDCAFDEIPVLSRAGLAMVAPTPNNPALTLPIPGATLYPTGTRNFARTSFRYDQEGVAAAHVASRLGLHRVYVYLEDPKDGSGSFMAQPFARAARRLGIHVIGPDSPAGRFRRLARRLKAREVDGVFLASNTVDPRLIGALRAELGRSVPLIGSDIFLPIVGTPREVRRAERGMYVLGADITDPARQLPPAGRAFAAAFAATRPAGASDAWAPYAAQATDVLLTAIARSDGTRASVIHQLLRVRVEDGILGSFYFTPRGDISPSTVLVYRVTQGRTGTRPVTTITTPTTVG